MVDAYVTNSHNAAGTLARPNERRQEDVHREVRLQSPPGFLKHLQAKDESYCRPLLLTKADAFGSPARSVLQTFPDGSNATSNF